MVFGFFKNLNLNRSEEKLFLLFLSSLLFCLTIFIIVAIQFPIYTDDVCYLIFGTRFFQDGIVRPPLFPKCPNQGNGITTSITLIPTLIINSVIYSWIDSALKLRIFSIFLFLLWMLILLRIRIKTKPEESNLSRILLSFIPLSGILPFSFTMARQEQIICVLLSLLYFFSINNKHIKRLTVNIIYWLVPSYLIMLHPKTIFLYPVVIFLYFQLTNTKINKFCYLIWIAFVTANSFFFLNSVSSCKETPALDYKIRSFNTLLTPEIIINNPISFIKNGFKNIYVQLVGVLFQNTTKKFDWTSLYYFFGNSNYYQDLINISVILLILFYPVYASIKVIYQNKSTDNKSILSLLILFCLLALCFFTNAYLFYYPTFLIFNLYYAFLLTCPNLNISSNRFIHFILLANALSVIFLCGSWLFKNSLFKVNDSWLESMENSSKSNKIVSRFYTPTFNSNYKIINQVTNLCELKVKNNSRLIVDEETYFYFKGTRLPIMAEYNWFGFDNNLDNDFVLKNFDGAITSCNRMPEFLMNKVKRIKNLCCVSFKNS